MYNTGRPSNFRLGLRSPNVKRNNRHTLDLVYVEVLNVNPCKHRDCLDIIIIDCSKTEFRGQFPYLDN